MVVAASQIPPGGEPHAPTNPPGPTPVQGARFAGPSSSSYRGPNPIHPDRQQQPNAPFFYVQPTPPSLPYQWPMPMCYVPYGGFSGFGYGMVLPPFPPASYVDAPGYILPHSQMHMVDYRRMMAPHSAPTMAYQARRFRFQHTTPSSRVMVSCEVQTDSSLRGGDDALRSQPASESGRSSGPGSILSSTKPSNENPAHLEEATMSSSNKTEMGSCETSNPGILFQAEEVRIECRGSPTGLKIIHSKEIAELARRSNGELLQCNMESSEDLVLRCFQPVPYTEDEQREPMEVMSHVPEPYLPPCPDILMMRSCPSNGTTTEGSAVTASEPCSNSVAVRGDPSIASSNEESMQHPLELQCLGELPPMEASVWSVESLLPYVPSPGWLTKNGLVTPQKPSLPTVREVPAELPLDSSQSLMQPSQEKQVGTVIEFNGVDLTAYPESRPHGCPSSSQLADFGDPGCSKALKMIHIPGNSPEGPMDKTDVSPDTDVEALSPPSARDKLNKEQTNQRTKTSGIRRSDQDGSSARQGLDFSLKHKERFCRSCIIKLRAGTAFGSPSLKGSGTKRPRVAHLHKSKVQLCNMCMHDPEKTKSGNGGSKVDHEISENAVYSVTGPKKCPRRLCNVQNVPSGRHAEKCPMSHQSKLREQNCLCEHSKVSHCNLEWNSKDTRERNEENLSSAERWRDAERLISQHRGKRTFILRGLSLLEWDCSCPFSLDKSWRGVVSETDSIKSGGKTTPKKQTQCAPTPEIHRKDTRC